MDDKDARIAALKAELARVKDALRQANSVRDVFAQAVVQTASGEFEELAEWKKEAHLLAAKLMERDAECIAERERRKAVEKDAVRCQGLRAAQRDTIDEKNRLISAMGSRNSMLDAELADERERRERADRMLRYIANQSDNWRDYVADHFARYKD